MSQNLRDEKDSISETKPQGRKRSNTKHKLPAVHAPLSKEALANTGYQEQVIEGTDKAKYADIEDKFKRPMEVSGEACADNETESAGNPNSNQGFIEHNNLPTLPVNISSFSDLAMSDPVSRQLSHQKRSSCDVVDKVESKSEDGWKLIDTLQNARNSKVVPFLSKSQSLISRDPIVEKTENLSTLDDLRATGYAMPPLTDAGKKALAEQANLLSEVPVRQNVPQIEDVPGIPTPNDTDNALPSTVFQSTLAQGAAGVGTDEHTVIWAPNVVSNQADDSVAQSNVPENKVGSEAILLTDNCQPAFARPKELCWSAPSSITSSQITENTKSTTFSEVIKMLVAVIDKELEVTSRLGSEAFSRRDLTLAEISLKKSTKLSEFRQVAVSLLQEYS